MVFVDARHCPDARYAKVGLACTKKERNRPNNLTICHRFERGQVCRTKPRRQRFCIDRYEFPNEKGGHPPVQVSAFDAAAMCAERNKRLCWESEWVAACEGPDAWPFPYGHVRSKKHCNIDNPWRKPSLKKVYSKRRAVQDRELRRLDQSVPSGSMESCKSGYGVYDLTGNFDEWVMVEYRRGRSKWAGLKGGLGSRAQRLSPDDDQPCAVLQLLFHRLSLLQGSAA
jgi:formylglycine-generating enzyme required for sulfatase activity